jgi:hypothetical protein
MVVLMTTKIVVYGHSIEGLVAPGPGECDSCFEDYRSGDTVFAIREPEAVEVIALACSPRCAADVVAELVLPRRSW